jgi:hypothetical protein
VTRGHGLLWYLCVRFRSPQQRCKQGLQQPEDATVRSRSSSTTQLVEEKDNGRKSSHAPRPAPPPRRYRCPVPSLQAPAIAKLLSAAAKVKLFALPVYALLLKQRRTATSYRMEAPRAAMRATCCCTSSWWLALLEVALHVRSTPRAHSLPSGDSGPRETDDSATHPAQAAPVWRELSKTRHELLGIETDLY